MPHLRYLVIAAFAACFAFAPRLAGSAEPAVKPAAAPPQANAPAGGKGPRAGSYECWHFNRARLDLNFTLQAGGRYLDSENKAGSYTVDAGTGRIRFKGGALDGQSPVYHEPRGRPTVSFRNSQGTELDFCELVGK